MLKCLGHTALKLTWEAEQTNTPQREIKERQETVALFL